MTRLSPHFARAEFACKCPDCQCDSVDSELLDVLEELREMWGAAVTITSAHRCPAHNLKVGGSPRSQHLYARAADVQITNIDPHDVYAYLDAKYPDKYGLGDYETFTHVDTRSGDKARW